MVLKSHLQHSLLKNVRSEIEACLSCCRHNEMNRLSIDDVPFMADQLRNNSQNLLQVILSNRLSEIPGQLIGAILKICFLISSSKELKSQVQILEEHQEVFVVHWKNEFSILEV